MTLALAVAGLALMCYSLLGQDSRRSRRWGWAGLLLVLTANVLGVLL